MICFKGENGVLTDFDPDPEDSLPKHAALHGVCLVHLRWLHVLRLGHLGSLPHQGNHHTSFQHLAMNILVPRQETETVKVRACHTPRQPVQKHPSGHF